MKRKSEFEIKCNRILDGGCEVLKSLFIGKGSSKKVFSIILIAILIYLAIAGWFLLVVAFLFGGLLAGMTYTSKIENKTISKEEIAKNDLVEEIIFDLNDCDVVRDGEEAFMLLPNQKLQALSGDEIKELKLKIKNKTFDVEVHCFDENQNYLFTKEITLENNNIFSKNDLDNIVNEF